MGTFRNKIKSDFLKIRVYIRMVENSIRNLTRSPKESNYGDFVFQKFYLPPKPNVQKCSQKTKNFDNISFIPEGNIPSLFLKVCLPLKTIYSTSILNIERPLI